MRHADLFVLFSKAKGCPTVIREALAEGTPVLSTDVSGARELIEQDVTGLCGPELRACYGCRPGKCSHQPARPGAAAAVSIITRYDALMAGTATLGQHVFLSDHYRCSEQAVRKVFLQDLADPRCRWLMTPPRIVGWTRTP